MKNFKQEGKVLSFTAGADYLSGAVVLIGDKIGIVSADVVSGAEGEAALCGVFELTKAASQAWALGDKIYWDISSSHFTKTKATDTVFAGICAKAVADGAGDVLGWVSINDGYPSAANVAAIATADGSDPATTQALANALKVSVNAILVALKDAGIVIKDA